MKELFKMSKKNQGPHGKTNKGYKWGSWEKTFFYT